MQIGGGMNCRSVKFLQIQLHILLHNRFFSIWTFWDNSIVIIFAHISLNNGPIFDP